MKKIKLVYIGGGSKAWARVFMNDLALTAGLGGELALYDIDPGAAELNRRIGERLGAHPDARSRWDYVVYEAFLAQPLCTGLSYEAGEQLFREMALGTAKYLEPWYDLAILQ